MSEAISGICLVDPFLKDFQGHYFNYAQSISRAAQARRLQYRGLVCCQCLPDIQKYFPVEPIFRLPSFLNLPSFVSFFLRPLQSNWCFYRDISLLRKATLSPHWLMLFPNADHHQLLGCAAWLRRLRPDQAPTVVIMHRISYFNPELGLWAPSMMWLLPALRILEQMARRFRIFFVTDSAILAEEYQRLTTLTVHVLPIPHTNSANSSMTVAGPTKRSIKMISLGSARWPKGFTLLVKAIEQLHTGGQMHGLYFDLHCYYPLGEPAILEAIARLKMLKLPNVKMVDHPLNEDEYCCRLHEADVVLIPYLRRKYHANTSGTFVEAVAAGKPVVVTEGTWMSAQLQQHGAGVTFRNKDAGDLARAICEARDNYTRLSEKARAHQATWTAYHNPDHFVGELLRIVAGAK